MALLPEPRFALAGLLFALMGAGGSLCSSTAQTLAFHGVEDEALGDASALWNLNRQLSFCLGTAAIALLLALAAGGVQAQQKPVDIGFIGTLSTPAGYIGEDERDAFMLAVKEGGGKLGGVPVNVRVEDDALKPAN
ncbi:ABC transporter substrate-binding protein, partial [Escherichia coli]|uniref:ABC transporter substrate-binding protein n=1 Tax=Escherichia coli TaxID=562 RepID=UPI003D2F0C32